MPRPDTHPIVYAAGEAMAQGAQVALIVWEAGGKLHYRTVPDSSPSVLIGLHAILADVINAADADDDDAD